MGVGACAINSQSHYYRWLRFLRCFLQADTTAFAAQMSDQNFPLIMANNRQASCLSQCCLYTGLPKARGANTLLKHHDSEQGGEGSRAQVFQALQSWMESQPKASVPVTLTRCSVMSGRLKLTSMTHPSHFLCEGASVGQWHVTEPCQ